MKNPKNRPAVFLDRDGTLIWEAGYLDSPEKIEMIPGAGEALRILGQRGFLRIIVSNQSGVARGYFDEDTVRGVQAAFEQLLRQENSAVDAFYFCPHHPTEGRPPYRIRCNCRKPQPGMLLQAARDFSIDLTGSYMIGDKESDIAAGKKLGLTTILVLTGYGRETAELLKKQPPAARPTHIAGDIAEAARLISGMRK